MDMTNNLTDIKNFEMGELLPIVSDLAQKYTSKESSSISYEKARMLMDSVMYCLDEYNKIPEEDMEYTEEKVNTRKLYEQGLQYVYKKVLKSKELYEEIIRDFHSYNCRSYYDTIINGIPNFFLWYDPVFKPQDHLLTLDYPTIKPLGNLRGVDAIYQYLCSIKLEWQFLNAFPDESIMELLHRMMPDYEELLLDNICSQVLRNAIACVIVEKPIGMLKIEADDLKMIKSFFNTKSRESINSTIQMITRQIVKHASFSNAMLLDYLLLDSEDFTVLLENAMKYDTLEYLFPL